MKCCIVKDLLPGYIDGLTSEETNEEIKMHLKNCSSCNTIYRQMTEELPVEIPPAEKEIDFLKKLKASMRRKYVIVVLSTCAVLIGSAFFLKRYEIPVSYDPDCMSAELYTAAFIPNSRGLREWQYIGTAGGQKPDQDEGKADGEADPAEAEDNGGYPTIKKLRLVLNLSEEQRKTMEINNFTSNGRTIRRNGKDVRVVYYCYTRKLWNSLFGSSFVNGFVTEGDIYEESFFRNANEDYQPIEREIYYLPTGDMDRLDGLSDEEFDAQKENAELVWSGVI